MSVHCWFLRVFTSDLVTDQRDLPPEFPGFFTVWWLRVFIVQPCICSRPLVAANTMIMTPIAQSRCRSAG